MRDTASVWGGHIGIWHFGEERCILEGSQLGMGGTGVERSPKENLRGQRWGGLGTSGCVPFPHTSGRVAQLLRDSPPSTMSSPVRERGGDPPAEADHTLGVWPAVETVPVWDLVRLMFEHTSPRQPALPGSAVVWPCSCAPGLWAQLFCVWV